LAAREKHMKIKKEKVKRILLITLSNVGDVVLTTPVLDVLDREFPSARMDVMVGPLGKDIFTSHPKVFKVVSYNKHIPFREKGRIIRKLRKIKYDLIVDLRNSFFPYLIGSRYKTSLFGKSSKRKTLHKRDTHLWKLKRLGMKTENARFSVFINKHDRDHVNKLVEIAPETDFIAVSPGAKSFIKRWNKMGFIELCDKLISELKMPVVIIGDESDSLLASEIEKSTKNKIHNFTGKTSITQLAYLLKKCKLLITNDSAPMHLGAAVKTRVLAIFGPTDPKLYGPQESKSRIVKKMLKCSPCGEAQCKSKHECMKLISPDDIFKAAKEMLKK